MNELSRCLPQKRLQLKALVKMVSVEIMYMLLKGPWLGIVTAISPV